jgi:ATP-dependent Clp protease ATP-binding subunit ClpB
MHLSYNILIMDLNNFTNKSQEIISNAQYLTTENGHQAIENAHILSALIKIDKNVFPFITKKIGANTTIIDKANKSILQNYPKVNGSSVYLSKNSQTTIN